MQLIDPASLLKESNLAAAQPKPNVLQTIACQRCQTVNIPRASYCTTCTLPLNANMAYQECTENEQLVLRLAKVLVEQGLIDQAVQEPISAPPLRLATQR
jgi:hypothetical protein